MEKQIKVNNMEEKSFTYTYSAKEQNEIKQIRNKYTKKEKTTLEKIKELDASTTKRGTTYSIIIGIIGSLLLGIGMCFTMIWTSLFVLGIIIGIIGIVIICIAYPTYKHCVKIDKEKVKDQILELCENA